MAKHKYKIGERIFYECYDGTIGTSIIINIEEDSYTEDGKEYKFDRLILTSDDSITCSIEDYNCLSKYNEKCKSMAKEYDKFDKKRDEIIESIMDIIGKYSKNVQEEIINLLKVKIQ